MKNFYNIFKNHKKKILCLSLFFLLFTIGFVFAQEVEYPQLQQGMETPTTFETFAKYVFNFIVVCSGLIALAALIWGGFKYLTSMGDPDIMKQGKKQILCGFLGVIILLGSYTILATINPQLTIFNLEKLKKVEFPEVIILTFEYPSEAIRSYQSPIGKLIDGIRIKGNATSTGGEAVYGKANITKDNLKDYTTFNNELDGKLSALSQTEDDNKIESLTGDIKGMRPRFRKSYSTKIEDVNAKINAVNQARYDEFTGQETARVSGLENVSESTNNFSNKYDDQTKEGVKNLVSDLKNRTSSLKNFSGNEIDIDSSALSNLENFKEKYDEKTEKITDEIEDRVNNVKMTSYEDDISRQRMQNAINELKETTKSFKEGYQIREDIWQTSEQSLKMSDELDKYRDFSKWKNENENFKEVNFFYEGAVAETKMKRILELDKEIREKSEQIQALGLFMMTASKVLVVITPPCECLYCIKTCTLCVGDPCPTRPAIIAAQNVLGRGVMALPGLSAQLQKYTDELKKERKLLQQSVKELERVRKIVEDCSGVKNKNILTPYSIEGLQDYKDALEAMVSSYKIKTVNSWQEIQIKNDPFTMYCLKIPAIGGGGKISGSPFGTQKVLCETEIKVGELIDATINTANKIIDKIDETTDSSQDIVNEASRMVPSGPVRGIYGELLKKEKITKECSGKVARETEDILNGKQIKELLIYIENSTPYKYDKDIIGKLMEKIPEKDLKKIISQAIKDTEGKKLKKDVVDYLGSLKNPEKKEICIWLFEAMPEKELKNALLKSIDSIKEKDIKAIWENQLREMGKQGIGQLFGHIIEKFEKKDLKTLFEYIFDAFPENEDRDILKAMLKGSSRLAKEIDEMLKDCKGENIEEKVDNASDIKGKLKITLGLLYKIKENAEIKEQFRESLSTIQEENFERGIKKCSGSSLKKITKKLISDTPDYEIKDMIVNDFVSFNNNFFQEIINNIPDSSLPKMLTDKFLKPIPEKDLKKIIEKGIYPISEPGEIIVSLIGNSPSTDKNNETINDFSEASEIIRKKLRDEFFEEAIDAMEQSQGKKDALSKLADKIICFGPKEIKKTVNEILEKLKINEKQMRGFVNDVLEKSPETTLRKVSENIEECFSSNDKTNKKILEKFSEYRQKRMAEEKGKSPSLKIIMSYVPDAQLLDAMEILTKEASKEDLKKCLDKTLDYSPEGINKIAGDLSKNIPDKSIKDIMDKIFKSFPDNKTGNEDIDKFIRNKVSTFMADRLLGTYIDKIAGFISKNNGWSKLLSEIKEICKCDEVNIGNIEEFTRGVLAGNPGLKQNGKYMIKITSNIPEGCSCIHGHCMSHHIPGDGCSTCTGGDVCPYNEITKTYKIIKSYNNENITKSFQKLIKSSQETDKLIEDKVKNGIYVSLADTRKNFSDCSMKGKDVGNKRTFVKLWRADDTVNYSWVNKYRHKLNFWCCYPKN